MRLTRLFVLILGLSLAGGCATDMDSDMPWSTPQPWEGAPGIPGFTPQGR